MLKISCPKCGNLHYADEQHAGKMLRCARCGDSVQIGMKTSAKQIEKVEPDAAQSHQWSTYQPVGNRRASTPILGRVLRIKKAWILSIACVGLIVGALWWFSERSDKSTQTLLDSVARKSFEEKAALRAQTSANRVVGDDLHPAGLDQGDLHRSLPTGSRLRSDVGTTGKGKLTIENYSESDSIIKLQTLRGRTIRFVFIKKESVLDLPGIPAGSYKVRFCLGEDWDGGAKSFTRIDDFFEFGKTLEFTEVEYSDRTEFSHHEITLNTTPEGNVKRYNIDRSVFYAEE